MEQLSLFNETEAERALVSPESTIETITYKRKKKKGSHEKLLEQLPVKVIEYKLPESEENYPKCGNTLHVMSKEICKELKIVPAKVSVIEYVSYVYSCRNCDKNDMHTIKPCRKAYLARHFSMPKIRKSICLHSSRFLYVVII